MYPSITFLVREAAEDIDLGEGRVVPRWVPSRAGYQVARARRSLKAIIEEVTPGIVWDQVLSRCHHGTGAHMREMRAKLNAHHAASPPLPH